MRANNLQRTRDSLNFEGLIFSDDMQMSAIRSQYGLKTALEQAINAGIDVLVFANNSVFQEDITDRAISIVKRLVENGEIPVEQIDDSYQRIMNVKRNLKTGM
ncbi:MAG: glycoside hydrolase family 3 N-terminal domain-containing protein [Balneolaceae bacterium]|nr:glycoside hydrolase family 3 N-terminal domain-containing protein [Balneolaceae bacterium]